MAPPPGYVGHRLPMATWWWSSNRFHDGPGIVNARSTLGCDWWIEGSNGVADRDSKKKVSRLLLAEWLALAERATPINIFKPHPPAFCGT